MIFKIYNDKLESKCVRILYFFNSLDTYFLVAGILSFLLAFRGEINPVALLASFFLAVAAAKVADFYPAFLPFGIPALILLVRVFDLSLVYIARLFLINVVLFVGTQFMFMGTPNAIVARDARVPFIMIFNSLFTVAPTAVSFSMSVFYSFFLSFFMSAGASCYSTKGYFGLGGATVIIFTGALLSRLMLPKNMFSVSHKPAITPNAMFKKVVILNIDGARKDIFDSLNLPAMNKLIQEGASHTRGLETIYRALTNPAFASILTGTTPRFHGIRNNNFGQSIKTEGLPDVVPTIVYGSIHVKHFCKESWETRVVSLPRTSAYRCDDVVLDWLKEDMLARPEIRLFILDFSEADFLAHAYGSKSGRYKQALRNTDKRIGDFIDWMRINLFSEDTAVIVCSDHGVAGIDHSYLIADSEKYVPFFIYGRNIRKGFQISQPGKIMDICCTVAYLLGVRYPASSQGWVFTEVLEMSDSSTNSGSRVTGSL